MSAKINAYLGWDFMSFPFGSIKFYYAQPKYGIYATKTCINAYFFAYLLGKICRLRQFPIVSGNVLPHEFG